MCGGRLGVTSYTILHTIDAATARGSGLPSRQVVAASEVLASDAGGEAAGGEAAGGEALADVSEGDGEVTPAAAAAAEEEEEEEEAGSDMSDGSDEAGPSAPSAEVINGAVYIAVESDASPASFAPQNLPKHCQRLAKAIRPRVTSRGQAGGEASAGCTELAICFQGYCRWGRDQLQGEIARGSWEICEARSEDVLHADEGLWQRLRDGDRLVDRSGLSDE